MKFNFLSKSDQAYYIHKASTLVEALPYIRKHSEKNVVIKYGGSAMENKVLSESFSKDICLLKEIGINPIVVHGGGPQIAKKLQEKGISSNFIQGLRVTDLETIKIVEEVLSKNINTEIVKHINLSGGKAIGLSGNKKNLIKAKKLKIKNDNNNLKLEKKLNLGFVGYPTKLNNNFLLKNISNGRIPVIAPLGIDKNKKTLNINADTAAGFIASSIKASKLLLLTDVDGILDKNKKLISSLSINKAKKIVNKNFISGGMRPKILTCIDAIDKGVKEATILDGRIPHSLILELFTEHGIGTQIYS